MHGPAQNLDSDPRRNQRCQTCMTTQRVCDAYTTHMWPSPWCARLSARYLVSYTKLARTRWPLRSKYSMLIGYWKRHCLVEGRTAIVLNSNLMNSVPDIVVQTRQSLLAIPHNESLPSLSSKAHCTRRAASNCITLPSTKQMMAMPEPTSISTATTATTLNIQRTLFSNGLSQSSFGRVPASRSFSVCNSIFSVSWTVGTIDISTIVVCGPALRSRSDCGSIVSV